MTKKSCTHYWLIETPAGPTSDGVCQHCHEVRTFNNTNVSLAEHGPMFGRPKSAKAREATRMYWQARRDAKAAATGNVPA